MVRPVDSSNHNQPNNIQTGHAVIFGSKAVVTLVGNIQNYAEAARRVPLSPDETPEQSSQPLRQRVTSLDKQARSKANKEGKPARIAIGYNAITAQRALGNDTPALHDKAHREGQQPPKKRRH